MLFLQILYNVIRHALMWADPIGEKSPLSFLSPGAMAAVAEACVPAHDGQ